MSGVFANGLMLAILAAVLGPFAIAYRLAHGARIAAGAATLLVGATLSLYAPPWKGALVADVSPAALGSGEQSSQCAKVIEVSKAAGIILDTAMEARPVVADDKWSALPANIRRTLEACLDMARSEESRGEPMELIRR